ncbi:hypothetical protein FG379_000451 [Cryptosporidium bovis]|uniref:uncharacterized protein n=1 Tax=Cryptosporidium bovis TaxID=310047 RepID=UPI00351A295E|nr:hypothetical protein FG379_000451 [Cryptosporidium bovis]
MQGATWSFTCISIIELVTEVINIAMEDSINNIESLMKSQIYNLEFFRREIEGNLQHENKVKQLNLDNLIRTKQPIIKLKRFQYKVNEIKDRLFYVNYVNEVQINDNRNDNRNNHDCDVETYDEIESLHEILEDSYTESTLIPIMQNETQSYSSYYNTFSLENNFIYENYYLGPSIVNECHHHKKDSNYRLFFSFLDCDSAEVEEHIFGTFLKNSAVEEINENSGTTIKSITPQSAEKNNFLTKINEVYVKIVNSPDCCYTSSYVTVESTE